MYIVYAYMHPPTHTHTCGRAHTLLGGFNLWCSLGVVVVPDITACSPATPSDVKGVQLHVYIVSGKRGPTLAQGSVTLTVSLLGGEMKATM